MSYIGRFAPSPTGPLHFGSLVAALASYLDAKAHGGQWLVRNEDIDETRCNTDSTFDILQRLKLWGFEWDGNVEYQTDRKAMYEGELQKLRARGLLYACACSRREIADSAMSGLEGPVYPGTCRNKGIAEAGNAIRVKTSGEKIAFTDLVQGEIEQFVEQEIGDFVLKRRDGMFAYQLAVVADDAAQGVTHVVRGADLLDSTARQIHLQRLLGYPTPQYLHIPIAVNELGQKLSKQTLAPSITTLGSAHSVLKRALSFLGQETGNLQVAHQNDCFLGIAAKNWDRSRIPRVRTLAVTNP